jgi:tRNA(Ile)-lysidine synthase
LTPVVRRKIAAVEASAKLAALRELGRAVSSSGLLSHGASVVVMTSGGPDSAATAAGLAYELGSEQVHGLHINYGLREGAAEGEAAARGLCAALRIDLHVERPSGSLEGNFQDAARRERYTAAERLRARTGSDWIATGHTQTDIAETVVYRLASSPGTRALLGLAPRSGRVIRPLLAIDRERARELALAAALPFVDDETNDDQRFARNRIRALLLPALRDLNPEAIRNIAETRAELAEEAALLERVVLEALADAGSDAGSVAIRAAALEEMEPGLRRLALRALAERALGRPVVLGRPRAAEIMRLARRSQGGTVELGHGLVAECERGFVRFAAGPGDAAPTPVALRLPGRARIGAWEVAAELRPGPVEPQGPDLATLDAGALGGTLEVRTWRQGDRIRPLGMHGSKSLQDLFTDRGVPRSLRHQVPVVTVDGEIAWVAGVAVSERFRLDAESDPVAVLSARVIE